MYKSDRIYLTGDGPFSEINKFSTFIGMERAVCEYGVGGDYLRSLVDYEYCDNVKEND